jgi:hypothetical protein
MIISAHFSNKGIPMAKIEIFKNDEDDYYGR